jgi:leucyl/phenylalanyl-tRNA--protein transferase
VDRSADIRPRRADKRAVPLLPPGAPLWFPPPEKARHSGLLAAGGDLSPERLLFAYSRGIFPWYDAGMPILWWSPDPRCVLFPEERHIPRRLLRLIRGGRYSVSFNRNFSAVIRRCAGVPRPGQNGTWLLPEMIRAYDELHSMGFAFSVETWEGSELVGGLYGIQLGRVFFGESMFHLRSDASKTALAALLELMGRSRMLMLDCQQTTPHMLDFGAREIPRRDFLALLARGTEVEDAEREPDTP